MDCGSKPPAGYDGSARGIRYVGRCRHSFTPLPKQPRSWQPTAPRSGSPAAGIVPRRVPVPVARSSGWPRSGHGGRWAARLRLDDEPRPRNRRLRRVVVDAGEALQPRAGSSTIPASVVVPPENDWRTKPRNRLDVASAARLTSATSSTQREMCRMPRKNGARSGSGRAGAERARVQTHLRAFSRSSIDHSNTRAAFRVVRARHGSLLARRARVSPRPRFHPPRGHGRTPSPVAVSLPRERKNDRRSSGIGVARGRGRRRDPRHAGAFVARRRAASEQGSNRAQDCGA